MPHEEDRVRLMEILATLEYSLQTYTEFADSDSFAQKRSALGDMFGGAIERIKSNFFKTEENVVSCQKTCLQVPESLAVECGPLITNLRNVLEKRGWKVM